MHPPHCPHAYAWRFDALSTGNGQLVALSLIVPNPFWGLFASSAKPGSGRGQGSSCWPSRPAAIFHFPLTRGVHPHVFRTLSPGFPPRATGVRCTSSPDSTREASKPVSNSCLGTCHWSPVPWARSPEVHGDRRGSSAEPGYAQEVHCYNSHSVASTTGVALPLHLQGRA